MVLVRFDATQVAVPVLNERSLLVFMLVVLVVMLVVILVVMLVMLVVVMLVLLRFVDAVGMALQRSTAVAIVAREARAMAFHMHLLDEHGRVLVMRMAGFIAAFALALVALLMVLVRFDATHVAVPVLNEHSLLVFMLVVLMLVLLRFVDAVGMALQRSTAVAIVAR